MMKNNLKAVVLLSGGIDSATTLAIAQNMGFDIYALSFRYGQRHAVELEAAIRIARSCKVAEHLIIDIDLRKIGGSALTADIAVPKSRSTEQMGKDIPVTYVPARNTIFLSYALAWAEVVGANDIFIGVNALDYSGYPDCRPEYIAAYENMANLATKAGVEAGRN
jgi:7-cyano-7-deazaguanine synthase